MPKLKMTQLQVFQVVVGFFLIALMGLLYGMAGASGRWPPGHPWSGITLYLLAFVQFAYAFRLPKAVGLFFAGLVIVTCILWILKSHGLAGIP